MRARGGLALVAALGLAGCVGGHQRPPPRLETVLTGFPETPPVWDSRPAEREEIRIDGGSIVVAPGDSIGRIARRTGAGTDAIAAANRLVPPFTITPGQRLIIPGGRYHAIVAGDSGIAIARAYAIPWSRIIAANGLSDPFTLRAGQRLLIPDASERPGRDLEERAAAFRLDIDSILTGGEPALAENQPPAAIASPARPLPATVAIVEPHAFAGRFAWPIDGALIRRFGAGANLGELSNGIDLAVPAGTPIRAAADGVVAYVGTGVPAFGGLILIRHGDGWITAYAHAEAVDVTRGQAVKRGQPIGRAGATGNAETPQLHFEIRSKRAPIDPLTLLPARS